MPAVQLLLVQPLKGVPDINGAATGQREQVAAWILGVEVDDATVDVEVDPVEDHEPAALERIAGHERLRQIVQGCAVDDHTWPPHRIDEGPPGCVPQDVDLTAFGPIQERLPRVAVDGEFAGLQDLADLVLRIVMHVHLYSVHP